MGTYIKENLGKGSRQGDEEMTADEVETELTKLLSTPKVQKIERKPLTRTWGIPKNAAITVSSELRSRLCDWCEAQNQPCLPRSKGGQLLEACKGCYT